MTVQLFELRQAVHTAVKTIGKTETTRNRSNAAHSAEVHEYMLAAEARAAVNKRYDNARKALLSTYEDAINDIGVGNSDDVFSNGTMKLTVSVAKPRMSLDRTLLRQRLLDMFELTMDEVDELIATCMKEAKPAVTMRADIPD